MSNTIQTPDNERFGVVTQDHPPGGGIGSGTFRDSPDPGSPLAARVALVLVIVLVGLVMLLQQLGVAAAGKAPATAAQVTAPVGFDNFGSQARLYMKFWGMAEQAAGSGQGSSLLGDVGELRRQLDTNVTGVATGTVDQFRAALVTSFLAGSEKAGEAGDSALQRLEAAIASAGGESGSGYEGFAQDAADARSVWAGGVASLSAESRQRMLDRHGYFAQVLFASSEAMGSAQRVQLTEGGGTLLVLIALLGLLLFGVVVAAVVCFIVAIVRWGQGRIRARFVPPAPGGSVFLEVVAVLAAGFLTLKVGVGLVAGLARGPAGVGSGDATLQIASMVLQWLLLAVVFWPRLRGVPKAEMARRMGWTRGAGFFREVGAGLFAYFATLPLVMAAIGVTLVIVLARGLLGGASGEEAQPPQNPIIDVVASGNVVILGMLFVLATVWAPLVEETVFRGCMYRHLRSRLGVLLAAVLSAVTFGVMHGYEFLMLGPVIVLGFNFALMREWRDSLIAPIVTHMLHNATVLTIAIAAFSQLTVPRV